MRITLNGLIRLTVATGLALFSLCALIGQAGRRDREWPSEFAAHFPASAFVHVNAPGEPVSKFLDVRDGSEFRLGLEPGERLDAASCSPWEDQAGRRLLVGRYTAIEVESGEAIGQEFGMALYRIPDGKSLARIKTDLLPVAPPCWYPDATARVLFAAGDGLLHQFDFVDAEERDDEAATKPRAIAWDWSELWPFPPIVSGPYWPALSGFERTLIVSLNARPEEKADYGPSQIWWLRLDAAGDRVVAAGRLTTPVGGREGPRLDEQRAVLEQGPGGELLLLYQVRREDDASWELRVAPVEIGTGFDGPRAGVGHVIDQDKRVGNHALTADGTAVFTILRCWGKATEVRKVPLTPRWLARGLAFPDCLSDSFGPL